MTTLEAGPRPDLDPEAASRILRDHFGVEGALVPLPSYRDQNYRVDAAGGPIGVLKIAHPGEDPELLKLEARVLERLRRGCPGYRFPETHPTVDGQGRVAIAVGGHACWVRLLTWVDGVPLARARPWTEDLFGRAGAMLGSVDRALEGLDAPVAHRHFRWDLRRAPGVIETHKAAIGSDLGRALVSRLADRASARLARVDAPLPASLIHNDANDHNLLVSDVRGRPDLARERRVAGLIDFGDLLHTWRASEAAIASAYVMLGQPDPLSAAAALVGGYHRSLQLTGAELDALPALILQRLLVSVCLSAVEGAADPDNRYLTVSEAPAWALLERLDGISLEFFHAVLRAGCGLEPFPGNARLTAGLVRMAPEAAPILTPDPRAVPTLCFDLSVGSLDQGTEADESMGALSEGLFGRLDAGGGVVGLGRYDEARRWYDGDAYSVPGGESERRTVHLGVDLFAPAGTPVHAPLEGRVHSVADNAAPLDYGPTLILEHTLEGRGERFFSLYGHLDPSVLRALQPGDSVRAGDRVATLGDLEHNGGWPPHLHFQIMGDLLDRRGEFPGVAAPRHRAAWLSICPDPNLLLRIPGLERGPAEADRAQLLAERRRRLGPSLSVSYREPLTIVRGRGATLYDDAGRAYLDCVNNVAHVGHCHPRVVEAAVRQMGVLNTNTRYLHDNLIQYARRLADTLPDPLEVCFFVCSGSEANELALRMARMHTGGRDVLVVDAAYHGNTSGLVDMSPYKFDGPGGSGAGEHVHVVELPDAYRGRLRGPAPDLGRRYAESVAATLDTLAREGRRPAAFFCESILSCGGQIELPDGYLSAASAAVRAAGGVYVADEVQVGFGRVGDHMWAFQGQGVVPDIVTLGKPIGNGHPLGAVVTTREIAASFANGMEYFNTFGGNPVSCAVGLAVLDVIESEGLQARARAVGAEFKAGLASLMDRHPVLGDVRGRGLFLGVELVTDRDTRNPAPLHAAHLVDRLRQRGILLSTDGPDHNVIKIKPPLSFAVEDAQRVVAAMDEVLSEDAFQDPVSAGAVTGGPASRGPS